MPKTHGASFTPEHATWCRMRGRCGNPNFPQFKDYGGRGIRVCERWNSFENFLADMGPRPSAQHSLDRFPDNDGHYEPGNCRWATKAEQLENRRITIYVEINGVTRSTIGWSQITGISKTLIRKRWNRGDRGQALVRPPRSGRHVPHC